MLTGICKFWNLEKGYGFLTADDDGKDYYIHATCVERSGLHQLVKNQKVTFSVAEDFKTGRVKVDHVRLIV
jgi:cold shock protein